MNIISINPSFNKKSVHSHMDKINNKNAHTSMISATTSYEAGQSMKAVTFTAIKGDRYVQLKQELLTSCEDLKQLNQEYNRKIEELKDSYRKVFTPIGAEIIELEKDSEFFRDTLSIEEGVFWNQYHNNPPFNTNSEQYADNMIRGRREKSDNVTINPEFENIEERTEKINRLKELYKQKQVANSRFDAEKARIDSEHLSGVTKAKAKVNEVLNKIPSATLEKILKRAGRGIWTASYYDDIENTKANVDLDCGVDFVGAAKDRANDFVLAHLCGHDSFDSPNDQRDMNSWLNDDKISGVFPQNKEL